MVNGKLEYNYQNNRYGITNHSGKWIDSGLHCGECFEIFLNGKWEPTRIEMMWKNGNGKYYLIGFENLDIDGLIVRKK